jgi:tRNA (cytidine56-2'-O)-methyltransferase
MLSVSDMNVIVLRLGHRYIRDKRISTHVALVARAFGANGIVMSARDESVEESVRKITERWGGDFFVACEDWKKFIKSWNGIIVHLTMYGIPIDETVKEIRKAKKDVLVVVGSEKVPGEIFKLANYNVAVGNQPHSEVAALAIFLDRFFGGKELKKKFEGKMKILPSKDSKKVFSPKI